MTDHLRNVPAPILDHRGPDPSHASGDDEPIDLVVEEGRAVAWLSGEIDAANASDVLARAGLALADERIDDLVVDVSRVSFLDSSGLAILLTLQSRAADTDKRFALRGVTKPVARVIEITGVGEVFGLRGSDPGRC